MLARGDRVARGAAFLDRDGTIIRQVELMSKVSQLRLLPGAADAIRLLNEMEMFVVVVTNQPVVARGIAKEHEIKLVHDELQRRLIARGARIDAFYFCPHHPNATLEQYRTNCSCRKPEPGMIFCAVRENNIDLSRSVMIGDTTQDVMAGSRAGVRTILVRTGHGGHDPWQYDAAPDWTVRDLPEAVQVWKKAILHD
jgi:D-glycero-D-manno-heptose 1,7-bisphosphate phosphatase